jgi:3-oxoacyl-[acyl-carrier-protein] synthase II
MTARRRVVITGIGLLTPLGNSVSENWEALITGRSGIGQISRFDASDLPVRIAGEVRGFDPLECLDRRDARRMDFFSQLAVVSAVRALEDAGWAQASVDPERAAVIVGVGMGGIATLEEGVRDFYQGGIRKLGPFFIPRLIANMAPAHIAMHCGLKGENFAVVSACASGGHAIGEALRRIRSGEQDAAVAGGVEAPITPIGVAGFAVMRALSTRNEEPQRASRPFDAERDGFVIAEGAGMLVLETLETARQRGAHIYAEVVGYGANADAYHITMPAPEGEGARKCMERALRDAGVEPSEVHYINAHGTSTPLNDAAETQAIKKLFGEHAFRLAVSSTKSMTGHTLGAAGAIEAAYTALALDRQIAPPTINYEKPDPECDLDYVPNRARPMEIEVAMSNAFGFGGTNSTLVLRRWVE